MLPQISDQIPHYQPTNPIPPETPNFIRYPTQKCTLKQLTPPTHNPTHPNILAPKRFATNLWLKEWSSSDGHWQTEEIWSPLCRAPTLISNKLQSTRAKIHLQCFAPLCCLYSKSLCSPTSISLQTDRQTHIVTCTHFLFQNNNSKKQINTNVMLYLISML